MLVKKGSILISIMLLVFGVGINVVNANVYTNYFDVEMTNQEYNTLLNLGFSEDEIYYMDEATFNENKNLDATLVSKDEAYYKSTYTYLNGESTFVEISEDEYNSQNSIMPRGTVETTYKKMVSTLSKNGSYYRYKVSLSWKNIPSTRSYDIIGVGFEDQVYIYSPVYFNYYSCNTSGDCSTSTQYYDRKKTSTGGSVVYKVPSSLSSLSATLYYDVAKNTSSTIQALRLYGDYAHATSNISVALASDHLITRNGIELYSNVGYYDDIPCAVSSWSGTW